MSEFCHCSCSKLTLQWTGLVSEMPGSRLGPRLTSSMKEPCACCFAFSSPPPQCFMRARVFVFSTHGRALLTGHTMTVYLPPPPLLGCFVSIEPEQKRDSPLSNVVTCSVKCHRSPLKSLSWALVCAHS